MATYGQSSCCVSFRGQRPSDNGQKSMFFCPLSGSGIHGGMSMCAVLALDGVKRRAHHVLDRREELAIIQVRHEGQGAMRRVL